MSTMVAVRSIPPNQDLLSDIPDPRELDTLVLGLKVTGSGGPGGPLTPEEIKTYNRCIKYYFPKLKATPAQIEFLKSQNQYNKDLESMVAIRENIRRDGVHEETHGGQMDKIIAVLKRLITEREQELRDAQVTRSNIEKARGTADLALTEESKKLEGKLSQLVVAGESFQAAQAAPPPQPSIEVSDELQLSSTWAEMFTWFYPFRLKLSRCLQKNRNKNRCLKKLEKEVMGKMKELQDSGVSSKDAFEAITWLMKQCNMETVGGGIKMSNRNSRLRSRNKRKTRQIKRKTRKTRKIKRKTKKKIKRKTKRRSQRVRKIR